MLGAQVAVSSANGSLGGSGFQGGGRHKGGKLWGGPGGVQEGWVLGGEALKVGGANADGEGGEPIHGSHAADEGVVWDAPVDEAACSNAVLCHTKATQCISSHGCMDHSASGMHVNRQVLRSTSAAVDYPPVGDGVLDMADGSMMSTSSGELAA